MTENYNTPFLQVLLIGLFFGIVAAISSGSGTALLTVIFSMWFTSGFILGSHGPEYEG